MSGKIWRGGMIGAGAWSDIQLNAWAGVENAEIVALCDRHPDRRDPVVSRFNIPQSFYDFESMLDRIGQVPLPPYIKRNSGAMPGCDDKTAYQTVYASRQGAVAAPPPVCILLKSC